MEFGDPVFSCRPKFRMFPIPENIRNPQGTWPEMLAAGYICESVFAALVRFAFRRTLS